MSLSSPQPIEPGCPTTGSAAGTNGKDNIDSSAGIPGLASVATTILPAAATAALPSTATTATVPSGTTTASSPSGASSATTTGTSRATSTTNATTSSSDRRRTEQVERWDELSQRIGEVARRKAPQLQRGADESAGSRKRGLERIERFLDIAQKMKPGVLARYR